MIRMSRAGRKHLIREILMKEFRRDFDACFNVGAIARKMGLKSSTYLKNLCRELAKEQIGVYQINRDGVDYFGYEHLKQLDFLDRVIIINKEPVKVSEQFQRSIDAMFGSTFS